jgi:redox-sensitive bicupin YhaK (pirin superfamily)
MKILKRDSLVLGGFAGLTEHRLVTDSRVFSGRKSPDTFEGLGQFVYLADAKFNPFGETHMHPHKEIDVITVMLEGEVSHEGSLEHGQSLQAGEVQVQRAGGEGFAHNEINPDSLQNRLLQIWALPDELGQAAGYKHYRLQGNGITQIYGGKKHQQATFDSQTVIEIVRLSKDESYLTDGESMVYMTNGTAEFFENEQIVQVQDGDLIHSQKSKITAQESTEFVVIRHLV